jgi:8-oxo-dGTP diphosphatase
MLPPAVDVAVGILQRPDGKVLVAERTRTQISAGFWELPGGKIDPGETAAQAVVRELAEEIGITASALRPWIRYTHSFRLRRVRLSFFRVERWAGEPQGREGQRLAWIDPAAPAVAPILPSVERVLLALGLPPICAVSDSGRHGGPERFLEALPRALQGGIRLIQVREPGMAPDQRVLFARRVAALAGPHGARVSLAGTALETRRAGLTALHSTAEQLRRSAGRPRVSLWTVSCHDAADLQLAEQLGADAAIISPVQPSAAHPQRPPLGWSGLQRLAAGASIPLYAQGGMSPPLLATARGAGAVGIATADWLGAAREASARGS